MIDKKSLWSPDILRQASVDAVRKLDPRLMVKNPVMFVVEVGSVLTTALLIDDAVNHRSGLGFNLQITLWLWFTVLFANFAEAMAEGRGKAQADTLRKAKGETIARRYIASGELEDVTSSLLRTGDSRSGRRSLGGDGWDACAVRLHQGEDHIESGRDVSGSNDCAGRGSNATEDSQ